MPPSSEQGEDSPLHGVSSLSSSIDAPGTSPGKLPSWLKSLKAKGRDKAEASDGIFGVPLEQSIHYASVAISVQDQGRSCVYGYIPVIVAKCGVYLKENATEVEGIFRLSGSAKRIKELQAIFNEPPRFGKGLSWEGFTVHDAANVLRRYLNNLPEPIIPLEYYDAMRAPLQQSPLNLEQAILEYQRLIHELPGINRQLLLYLLDLLAVFASKSDVNRMTAANLAAIFQPGILNHPVHEQSPSAYLLSQDVLVFLVEHQDRFLLEMGDIEANPST